MLTQDFHANGALTGDDINIVIWMDKDIPFFVRNLLCVLVTVVKPLAVQDNFAAAAFDGVNLDRRSGFRHHDRRSDLEFLSTDGYALCVVPGRGGDDAPGFLPDG